MHFNVHVVLGGSYFCKSTEPDYGAALRTAKAMSERERDYHHVVMDGSGFVIAVFATGERIKLEPLNFRLPD